MIEDRKSAYILSQVKNNDEWSKNSRMKRKKERKSDEQKGGESEDMYIN